MPVVETTSAWIGNFLAVFVARFFRSGTAEETFDYVVTRLKSFRPKKVKYENLVMLLGIGGVGKTTLVARVTHNSSADNSAETIRSFEIYGTTRSILVEDPKKGSVHEKVFLGFADYRGQNIGTLLRGIAGNDKFKPTTINTVVLVVDLFPANRVLVGGRFINIGGEEPQDLPDEDRIEENCRVWSTELLKAVLGMLDGNALQKVIVFVNKVDLVLTKRGRDSALTLYEPLVDRVQKFATASDVEFEVILGSIHAGDNFFKLEDSLKFAAVER